MLALSDGPDRPDHRDRLARPGRPDRPDRPDRLARLRHHVAEHARNRPGVYRMLDADGEVVYVGKSVRVRTRLLSYFRAAAGDKPARILARAESIEWDYVPSEFAALLLELRSIKRWRPRFNREHKGDRVHSYVKITPERAPRLLVTDRIRADGADYYGPFRGRKRVREIIREASDLLGLRDCAGRTPVRFADQKELFRRDFTPLCLRAEIGRCLGPCAGRCTRADYLARVKLARLFLEGDATEPLRILRDRMRAAADRQHFEYAAALRDRMTWLTRVSDELASFARTLDDLSFLYTVPGKAGEDRLYIIRRGIVREELAAPRTAAERSNVMPRVEAALARVDPDLEVDPVRVAEMMFVARWFERRPEEWERTVRAEDWTGAPAA